MSARHCTGGEVSQPRAVRGVCLGLLVDETGTAPIAESFQFRTRPTVKSIEDRDRQEQTYLLSPVLRLSRTFRPITNVYS